MTNLSIIEFYFAKIESYLRRKNENALKVQEADKNSPIKSDVDEMSEKEE